MQHTIVHVFSEFAKEKDRVESRAGFLLLKEEQKLEKERTSAKSSKKSQHSTIPLANAIMAQTVQQQQMTTPQTPLYQTLPPTLQSLPQQQPLQNLQVTVEITGEARHAAVNCPSNLSPHRCGNTAQTQDWHLQLLVRI